MNTENDPPGEPRNTANHAPTAPVPVSPVSGSEVQALETDLIVRNATDPDGDRIPYRFDWANNTGLRC